MINYKYKVVFSTKFRKSLKKIQKQNKNIDELIFVIEKLSNKEELDDKYRNHSLTNANELLLLLINTGSHSELFK